MRKNIKFLKTKVEDSLVFMIMTKCDFCPYFMKKEGGVLRCGVSFDYDNKTNKIKDGVPYIIKNKNLTLIDKCDIPYWCILSSNMGHEISKNRIIYKKNGLVYDMTSVHNKETDKILSDAHIDFQTDSDLLKFNEFYHSFGNSGEKKISPVYNHSMTESYGNRMVDNIMNASEDKPNLALPAYVPKPYVPYVPPVVKEICSNCGVGKEEVKRDINNGVCQECHDKNDVSYKTLINNFRLKRKSTYSDLDFKIIKNVFIN